MSYNWNEWSEWKRLGFEYGLGFSSVPTTPGAYIVATDKPINRCVGTDSHGILTIGESDSLRRRLFAFCACAVAHGVEGHSAGWRFAFFRFDRFFSFSSLRFRWHATKTKEDAKVLESEMLIRYVANHVEQPPLNYKSNHDAFKIHGWGWFDELIGSAP